MLRFIVTALSAAAVVPAAAAAQQPTSFETVTADGVTVHGTLYTDGVGPDAPLILLFHQGGSSGRGEYGGEVAPWLNGLGYRAIAWDQRSGGAAHDGSNRTADGLAPGTPADFCDAAPDLQAALDYVVDRGLADEVLVWGSSYSGALAFGLASRNPEVVRAVIAFSPASGGPMAECRARGHVASLLVPMLVLRPSSEMERESSVEQRAVLQSAGVAFHVVEHGVHGSSMLVDVRTGSDMSAARGFVADWLGRVAGRRAPGPG